MRNYTTLNLKVNRVKPVGFQVVLRTIIDYETLSAFFIVKKSAGIAETILTADGLLSVGRKTLKILCHVLGACGRGFFLIWGLRPRTKTPVW